MLLGDFLIHSHGVVLADVIGHLQDFHADGLGAELNLQLVAHLDVIGCLGGTAVDRDTGIVTGLIGHGAPLDQPGDFQRK